MLNQRKDHLTAQKVEVALVFQQMLSTAEAHAYLVRNGVPAAVIERVLFHPELRRNYTTSQRGAFVHQSSMTA
jgi:hypothetical protein